MSRHIDYDAGEIGEVSRSRTDFPAATSRRWRPNGAQCLVDVDAKRRIASTAHALECEMKPHKMTPQQREMLGSIADGADPNLIAQVARISGKKEENRYARTMMALYRKGLLQIAKTGGLEISEAGRAAAGRATRAPDGARGAGKADEGNP